MGLPHDRDTVQFKPLRFEGQKRADEGNCACEKAWVDFTASDNEALGEQDCIW